MIEVGGLHALLAGLLFTSAFFSGSEAALFGLSASERKLTARSVQGLLQEPRALLATVLLINLVVNTLYFAFATRLLPGAEGWQEVWLGLLLLVGLLVLGEILPKILALRGRRMVAPMVAPLLRALVVLCEPLTRPLLWGLERVHGLLSSWIRSEGGITPEVLARVLERGAAEGALHQREADLLAGILELQDVRVREIMCPRVDTTFLDVSGEERDSVTRTALKARLTWLAVIDAEPDCVLGLVNVRDLIRHPERSIRQLVMPVKFVPEVACVLELLHTLREDNASEAVVVDEYGGTAGVVTAEDAFEQILGELRIEGEELGPVVEPLGGGRYRVPGGLSIREWNEAFGFDVVPREYETVAGFVTALLGRIPRTGDRLEVDELELVVHEVRNRRVLTVDLGLRPALRKEGQAAT